MNNKKDIENMQNYWNGRSTSYGFAKDQAALDVIAAKVKPYLPEGRLKVLDVGTGPGSVACAMATLGYEVYGVDYAEEMVKEATKNAQIVGLDVKFSHAPAGELPFEDNYFDVVISRDMTWVLPNPEQVFTEWKRVLKDGGLVIYWDGNHYLYQIDAQYQEWRFQATGKTLESHCASDGFDGTICDASARTLPLTHIKRPEEWDDIVLPKLGFDIISRQVDHPQYYIKHGIKNKGCHDRLFMVAINNKG